MNLKGVNIIDIIKVVIVLGSLFAAFLAIEDRYITNVAAKEMQQQTQQNTDRRFRQLEYELDLRTLGELQKQKRELRRELRQNPDDPDLQEEYQEILDEIKRVKARIEKYRARD